MNITNTDILSDEQLVNRHLNGDNSGFSILYKKYFNKVYCRCYGFTRDHSYALDLAQDVLLKVYVKLNSFKGDSQFSTWLFAITYNYCIEVYRKKKNLTFEPINDRLNLIDYIDDGFLEQFENKELDIAEAIQKIPEIDRVLLTMKYEHNLSIKELQSSFQLSASAVKMRLQRARHKIEKIYLQHNFSVSA